MKKFNLLLVPGLNNSYDLRMVNEFCSAFKNIGHTAIATKANISEKEIAKICLLNGNNVVLKINGVRKNEEKSLRNIRHISWYQDIFPGSENVIHDGLEEQDILYTLGDRKILGLMKETKCQSHILMTGIDKNLLLIKNHYKYKYDFSLCGFIPKNNKKDIKYKIIRNIKFVLQFMLNHKIIRRKNLEIINKIRNTSSKDIDDLMEKVVYENYEPLAGNLDINLICKILLNTFSVDDFQLHDETFLEKIKYYSQTYPRRIDRQTLILEIINFTKSLALFGPNWNTYKDFAKYHKGTINNHKKLIETYMSSKINLTNNTHGIGIHSRTLEVMATGGFIATHQSRNDEIPGGILSFFKPNEHFIYYKKDNLKEDLLKWVKDDMQRIKIGESAREVVKNNHLWEHRATRVIEDLLR